MANNKTVLAMTVMPDLQDKNYLHHFDETAMRSNEQARAVQRVPRHVLACFDLTGFKIFEASKSAISWESIIDFPPFEQ